jgi:hypothetical protein
MLQSGCPADRRHQATLQAIQALSAQTAQLRQAGAASIADQLALSVAASLTVAWLQPPQPKSNDSPVGRVPSRGAEPNPQSAIRNPQSPPSPETDPAALFQHVNKFSPLLVPLRRGDHYAEWLQIQRQWHALASLKHQDHLAAQKTKTNPVPRSLRDDGGFTKETIEKTAKALNLF